MFCSESTRQRNMAPNVCLVLKAEGTLKERRQDRVSMGWLEPRWP